MSVTDRPFDLVISGGKVIDGTGAPWYYADVAVKDGKIAEVARTTPGRTSWLATESNGVPRVGANGVVTVIDVAGAVVAPGFIDMHSHSDLSVLSNPTSDSKVLQGVTTEVIGQCGFSAAPMVPGAMNSLKAVLGQTEGINLNWRSFGDFGKRVESAHPSVNIAALVGHGTVRTAVMGFKPALPSSSELDAMKALVEEAMQDGAFGLSTGLIYAPGSYSDTAEVLEVAKAAAKHGGIYFTHMRSESKGLLDAVAETLRVGREAGMPVQISHMKCGGVARGQAVEYLSAVEAARREGIEVTGDQYPYTAGSTNLAAMLPPWVHAGGASKMVERLHDPATRDKIKVDMAGELPGWDNDFGSAGLDAVLITSCGDPSYVGRTVQQIADEKGQDPYDMMFDILGKVDIATGMVIFMMSEDDVRTIMRHETVMIGSDSASMVEVTGAPHPRTFGTFPRVVGQCVREGVLTLSQAVFKMTGLTASKLGLQDRGLLKRGFAADITVFDPDKIADLATYQKPEHPGGITYVLVNGEFVVKNGVHTGARPGKFLRKS